MINVLHILKESCKFMSTTEYLASIQKCQMSDISCKETTNSFFHRYDEEGKGFVTQTEF